MRSVKIPEGLRNLSTEELINSGHFKAFKLSCPTHGEYLASPFARFLNEIVYSFCPQCEAIRAEAREAEAKKEAEAKAQARERSFNDFLLNSGCTKRFLKERHSYNKRDPMLFKKSNGLSLYDFFKVKEGNFKHKESIILLGGCGIGKSLFSQKLIEASYFTESSCVKADLKSLIDAYKSTDLNGFSRLNDARNLAHILRGYDCLIVDEFDFALRERADLRSMEALTSLISLCYDDGIRTIILGNCNFGELKKHLPNKVFSRLKSSIVFEFFDLQDKRG